MSPKINPLSPRQQQVLELHCRGFTAREIAKELNIKVRTVETHREEINFKILGTKKGRAAVVYAKAIQLKILPCPCGNHGSPENMRAFMVCAAVDKLLEMLPPVKSKKTERSPAIKERKYCYF